MMIRRLLKNLLILLAVSLAIPLACFSQGIDTPSSGSSGITYVGLGEALPFYYIPFSTSIIPKRGIADLGSGTFTNADDTNRLFVDPTTGYYRAAAANEPRIGWAGGSKALLVEPAGTNSILQSRTFTHASWTNGGTSPELTENALGIKGDSNSACTITDDAAGTAEFITQSVVVPNDSNTHTISIFVAKDSVTSRFFAIWTQLTGGGTIQYTVGQINTSTGATSKSFDTGDNDSVGCVDMAGFGLSGWWRLWITTTNVGDGNVTLVIRIYPAYSTSLGGAEAAAAVGSCIIDNCQVELNQKFPSQPIITTTAAVSRTSEAGFPTYTIPASGSGTIFSEALGSELMPNQVDRDFSGASAWANVDINAYDETDDLTITADAANQYCTLLVASAPMTAGNVYKLGYKLSNVVGTWKVTDFDAGQTLCSSIGTNGTGLAIYFTYSGSAGGGLRLVANAVNSSGDFDDFTLKQVTNPSSEGGPPRGTVIAWVRPNYAEADIASDNNWLACGAANHLIYHDVSGNGIATNDATTEAVDALAFTTNTWYKIVVQYGYLSSNIAKMRIGQDPSTGISWGTAVNYDGAYTTGASLLIGQTLTGPYFSKSLAIYPDEILSDTFIDSLGSP